MKSRNYIEFAEGFRQIKNLVTLSVVCSMNHMWFYNDLLCLQKVIKRKSDAVNHFGMESDTHNCIEHATLFNQRLTAYISYM